MTQAAAFTEEMLPPARMSWNQVVAGLDEGLRENVISALTDDEAVHAAGDWFLTARREQMAPLWNWFIWVALAGRGWGKNFAGSNWLIQKHISGEAKNSGIIAATASDLNKYCVDGPSGILSQAPNYFRPEHQPSKTRLVWPNGSITSLFTSEKPDRLRGPNLDTAWCDELAAWQKLDETWDMLQLCLRFGPNPQAMVTTTPRPKKILRDLMKREGKDVAVTRGATYDNAANLSPRFIQEIIREYKGTSLERQEIYGELLDEFEGALWTYRNLDHNRVAENPVLARVGVGVDPAISSEEGADLTGIISGGLDSSGHGYVLGDHSLRASPDGWARKVIAVYDAIEADFIVAEKNQGGQMVEHTIHSVDPSVNVKLVHASRAKVTRAEPIAARYEQGKVHHVRVHKELEDQMCLFLPGVTKKSPDRVDALVWLFAELFGQLNTVSPSIRSLG